jgi:hypothetical protein
MGRLVIFGVETASWELLGSHSGVRFGGWTGVPSSALRISMAFTVSVVSELKRFSVRKVWSSS